MWLPTQSPLIRQLSMSIQRKCQLVAFPQLQVNKLNNRVSASGTPSSGHLPVLIQSRSITATKCITKVARSQPLSVSPNPLNHSLQVHLQTHSITASKCMFRLPRLRPSSLHDNGLKVHLQTRSIMASMCISPNSLHHSLQVRMIMASTSWYLQTRLNTASRCIFNLAPLWPPSASPNSLDHDLRVHL